MAKSLKELAQQALDVQDASNASGVVLTFSSAMTDLWTMGHGTQWVNTHPIVTLYLYKLATLNGGSDNLCDLGVSAAYSEVMAIVEVGDEESLTVEPSGVGSGESFTITDAQFNALRRKFRQNADGSANFKEFRARARYSREYIMLHWCGMWLGIEPDGYTHS